MEAKKDCKLRSQNHGRDDGKMMRVDVLFDS